MRLVFALCAFMTACHACGTPPMPKGPAPEYEDPPPPSWWEGGAPGAVSVQPSAVGEEAGADR